MLTDRQIEAFRAVMIAGSMVRAADMMSVTQPAVSRLIMDLEQELGLTLFKRRKGGLKASEEALVLYEEIKRSYHGREKIARAAKHLKLKRAGQLRIAGIPALTLGFIPRVIHDFTQGRPNLSITLSTYNYLEVVDMTRARHYDLGLAETPVDDAGLELGPVLRARCVCILPPAHRLAEKQTIHAHDLRNEPFVSLAEISTTRVKTDSVFEANNISRRLEIEALYSATICSFVTLGLGVSIIEPFTARDFANAGGIVRNFEPMVDYAFVLMRPSGTDMSPLLADFVEALNFAFEPHLIAP